MSHTHSFMEITTHGDKERRFLCSWCGTEASKPFPKVDPYTGVISPDTPMFTREDVAWLRDDVLANADGGSPEYVAWLRSLINRIESLLPPV